MSMAGCCPDPFCIVDLLNENYGPCDRPSRFNRLKCNQASLTCVAGQRAALGLGSEGD